MPGSENTYVFKTGRTRRLTLRVPFIFEGRAEVVILPDFPGYVARGGMYIEWAGFKVWLGGRTTGVCDPNTGEEDRWHGFHTVTDPGPPTTNYTRFGIQLQYPDGTWAELERPAPYLMWYARQQTFSGTGVHTASGYIQLYCDVAEYKELYIDTRTPRSEYKVNPIGSDPNPPNQDFIGACRLGYYEGPLQGGLYGASISLNGLINLSPQTIPAGDARPNATIHRPIIHLFGKSQPNPLGGGRPGGGSRTQRITSAYETGGGRGSDYLDFGHIGSSVRGSYATCTGDASGNLTLAHTEQTDTIGNQYLVKANVEPQREVAINGLVTRGFELDYGSDVTIRQYYGRGSSPNDVVIANGVHTEDVNQRYSDCSWEVCENSSEVNLPLAGMKYQDTFLRTYLKHAWLSSAKEDVNDWRVMAADDYHWVPFSVIHKNTLTIDDCNGPSGWTPTACVLSGTTTLRITATGSGAQASKSYSMRATEYRFIRVRAKSSTAGTMTITLTGSDSWTGTYTLTFPAADTYYNFDLDLCIPPGRSASADLTDSSWVAPGEYYGMRRLTGIVLAGMTIGVTYEVDYIRFQRVATAKASYLPPFDEKVIGADGWGRYRMSWGLVDGRQVADFPYRDREDDRDDKDRFLSMSQFRGYLTATDAYVVEPYDPPDSSERSQFYYADGHLIFGSREACWLAAEYYPSGTRTHLLDSSMTFLLEPEALILCDSVWVYPGVGNPAGLRSARFPYRYTKRLQTVIHGLTLDTTNYRSAASEVVTEKLAANIEETVESDTQGYYRFHPIAWRRQTGSEYWTVGTSSSGDIDVSSSTTLQKKLANRKFRWVGLEAGVPVVSGETAIDEDERGDLYVSYSEGTAVRLLRGNPSRGWTSYLITDPGGKHGVAVYRWGIILAVVTVAGAVRLFRSTDFGRSWTNIMAIWASGDYPQIACDKRSGELYAVMHNGTAIQSKRSVDGGNTWVSMANVATCPPQTPGITVWPVAARAVVVTYKDSAGAVRMRLSTDGMRSWRDA